jgi:PadR family transcriptional regulator PadR
MGKERRITKQLEEIVQILASDPAAEWSGTQIARKSGLKSGTLYPALLRMHNFGWLTWRWEEIDPSEAKRPRRRLYKLTGRGELAIQRILGAAEVNRQRTGRKVAPRSAPRSVTT